MILFCIAIIIAGYWIDRLGRRPLLWVSAVLLLITSTLLYKNINHLSANEIIWRLLLFSMIFGLLMGTISALFTEIFPSRIRVLSLSLAFNIPLAVVGGFTPLLLQMSAAHENISGIAIACILISAIALVAAFFVDDMTGKPI